MSPFFQGGRDPLLIAGGKIFLRRLNHDSLDSHDYLDCFHHGNPIIPKIMVQTLLRRLNHDSLDSYDCLDYFNHGNPIIPKIMVQTFLPCHTEPFHYAQGRLRRSMCLASAWIFRQSSGSCIIDLPRFASLIDPSLTKEGKAFCPPFFKGDAIFFCSQGVRFSFAV